MDFELTPLQRAIAETLDAVLDRHLGRQRARDVIEDGGYDDELEAALRAAGITELFGAGEGVGPLDATLAVERIAAELGSVSAIAHLLVAPALDLRLPPGAVALDSGTGDSGLVRYGPQATTLILVGAQCCELRRLDPEGADRQPSVYGFPIARPVPVPDAPITTLAPGSARVATDWWRVGLAAEAVGLMSGALDVAVQYALDRTVFNRALGSFQALQHRLAECTVLVEGARWLVYEAAAGGARTEAAATAASHAVGGLSRLVRETHQIMGAIGLTREHDLHLWTFRMQALRAELGGVREHRRELVEQRWPASPATRTNVRLEESQHG